MISRVFSGITGVRSAVSLLLALAFIGAGCTASSPKAVPAGKADAGQNRDALAAQKEVPDLVQAGDYVTVNCKADVDGKPIPMEEGGAVAVVAGTPTRIPGLGTAVLGMTLNQKRHKTLSPGQAFGFHDEKKIKAYDAVRTIPVVSALDREAYIKNVGTPPVKGDLVQINPFFMSQVIAVDENRVHLKNRVKKDGFKKTTPLGTTTVSTENGMIDIRLTPVIGALFQSGKNTGRVIRSEGDKFWVDYNHPLVGKSLDLDLEVTAMTKASAIENMQIPWIEDYEFAEAVAEKKQKNMVLVLYADWCPWCEKMLTETFKDPRLKMLKDEFVWVKVNSDKNKDLGEKYKQHGFPLTVFTDDSGSILKKIEGFKDAATVAAELKLIIGTAELGKAAN